MTNFLAGKQPWCKRRSFGAEMGKWERGCGGAAAGCDLLGDWHAPLGLFLLPFNILQHRTKTSPREWPGKVARSNAFPISAPMISKSRSYFA